MLQPNDSASFRFVSVLQMRRLSFNAASAFSFHRRLDERENDGMYERAHVGRAQKSDEDVGIHIIVFLWRRRIQGAKSNT